MSNKNTKNNNILISSKKGGNVLASGGFGCVFSPALKCEGSSTIEKGKISKLMTEKHATEEYNEINSIREQLKDIPDYEDYYLVNDLTLCKPAKLNKSDLKDFTKKCKALPKDNITKDNINESLDKLMTLNMPNGGIPVDDYIYNNGSFDKLYELNDSLIKLLKHGILPMNKKRIYHCDIKDSNILVDDSDKTTLKARLIDWGLSTEYKPFKNESFPKTWRNRPFQFNVPFSVVLFTDAFVQKFTKYFEDGGELEEDYLKPFIIDYIHFWIKERGAGHYKFINEIMYILFSSDIKSLNEKDKKDLIETNFTLNYISNYLTDVLIKYATFREDGTLNLRIYLDNVFVYNVDIWGFCVTYFPILELLFNNYSNLTSNELEMFTSIKKLFIHIYTTSSEKLNTRDIINHLKNLGDLFISKKSTSARGIKLKSQSISKSKGLTGHTFVPKSSTIKSSTIKYSKINFKKKSKNTTRKFKDLFMLSTKLKKEK